MPRSQLEPIVRYLRKRHAPAGDADLLERFISERDADAFAGLVRRHGTMVLGVCRRILADEHAAEDACQATFLALARQARSIRKPATLPAWLHGVAIRTARRFQSKRNRTRSAEAKHDDTNRANDPLSEVSAREFLTILDDELARLPESYRLPLLLCGLNGATRDEAARQLGCTLGTLHGRLERGRELLRQRLEARGLTLPAALAGVLVAEGSAAMSAQLVAAVTKAALAAPAVTTIGGVNMAALAGAILLAIGGGAGLALRPDEKGNEQAPPNPPVTHVADSPRFDAQGEPIPDGVLARIGSVNWRHGGRILNSALSPDGKLLATAGDLSLVLWNAETGQMLRRFPFEGWDRLSRPGLTFSQDGRRLVYNCGRTLTCMIDTTTLRENWRAGLQSQDGKKQFTGQCQFTPDGREIALTESDSIVFRNVASGRVTRAIAVKNTGALSRDCQTFVALDKWEVVIGSVINSNEILRLDLKSSQDNWCYGLAISPDGQVVAIVNANKEIQVREWPGGKTRFTLPLPDSARFRISRWQPDDRWHYQLSVSPDGQTLLLGTRSGSVHRWNLADGKELPVLTKRTVPQLWFTTGNHIFPDGRSLVSTGLDGVIRFWDLQTSKERKSPDSYVGSIRAALSRDGQYVAVGDSSGRLDLWNAADGKLIRNIQTEGPGITNLAFAPDGRTLAAGQSTGVVQLWETLSGRAGTAFQSETVETFTFAHTLHFAPDGDSLYVSDHTGKSSLWNISTKTRLWHGKSDQGAAFSTDGLTIAASGSGPFMALIDSRTGVERSKVRFESTLRDNSITTRPVACSADGHFATSVDKKGTIVLCEQTTGREIRRFQLPQLPNEPKSILNWPIDERRIESIAFSPNGKWLAVGGYDLSTWIFDVLTGHVTHRLVGHESLVSDLAFFPDGKRLLSAGNDGSVFVWTLQPKAVSTKSPENLWTDLGADGVTAYQATWAVSDAKGIDFLRNKLEPASLIDRDSVLKQVAQLNSDEFRVRESATQTISKMSSTAMPVLTEALPKVQSAEGKKRLQQLIDDIKRRGPTPGEIQQLRAVHALELAGTAPAREHLRTLAAGAPGARLTEAAAAALKCMGN